LAVAHRRVFGSLQAGPAFRVEPPSRIAGHLYLGSAQNAAAWAQLRALNVTHIVVVGEECRAYFPSHFRYLHCAVGDREDDRRIADHFDPAFDFIEEARAAGSAALVHCFCGVSRSAAVVAACLMRANGLPLADALTYLQVRRPRVNPNRGFLDCLEAYGRTLDPRGPPSPRSAPPPLGCHVL